MITIDATRGVIGIPSTPTIDDPTPADSFTFEILTQPENGVAEIVDGQIRYTPEVGYTGDDFFTYRVTDSAGGSVVGTASVSVSAVDTAISGVIDSIGREGNRFSIGFQSEAGATYFLETKTSLTSDYWEPVSAVVGTGEALTLEDPDVGAGTKRRFYRLRIVRP